MHLEDLFASELRVVNIGVPLFYDELQAQAAVAVHVAWKPPRQPTAAAHAANPDRTAANREALRRINAAEPMLLDVRPARELIPGMHKRTILHAGPKLPWDEMCGPLRGAVLGAIKYEGLAVTDEEALAVVKKGGVDLGSNHDQQAVGPMAGVISASMPLYVVRNEAFANYAYCNLNEGLGKVLRFGANDEVVLDRLRWIEKELAVYLGRALREGGGLPLNPIIAQALSMSDEMHQRNVAASSLFFRRIIPVLAKFTAEPEVLVRIAGFLAGNDQLFLNLAMAAAKAAMDPVRGIEFSTVVTAMARNGTRFGIRVSSLGEQWFEAPAPQPEGLYFPGYRPEDAAPDMGDSAIVEAFGLGGMAMAAAPAVTRFTGSGSVKESLLCTRRMREITVGASSRFFIPSLEFIGIPTGIDIMRVEETGILPVINTGIAHRDAGVGQIGAGTVMAPLACFQEAIKSYRARYGR